MAAGGGDGELALVATPIGNLGDITARAVQVLTAADRVLAEDTRRARALLSHLGIEHKPIHRLDAHTADHRIAGWVRHLQEGQRLALVTDAGTPLVADPGAALVRAAAAVGIAIVPVPGPSAVMAAVSASGIVAGAFRFFGFLPRSKGSRRRALECVVQTEEAVVLFESPHRARATVQELAAHSPHRAAVLAREMTKIHEQFVRGTLAELAASLDEATLRGEITLVLGPAPEGRAEEKVGDDQVDSLLAALLEAKVHPKEAAKIAARQTGRATRDLYRRTTELGRSRGR